MEEKDQEQERKRKAYAPKGQRSQKTMNFRIDLDNWEYLNTLENKGRYLNELIAADRAKRGH